MVFRDTPPGTELLQRKRLAGQEFVRGSLQRAVSINRCVTVRLRKQNCAATPQADAVPVDGVIENHRSDFCQ